MTSEVASIKPNPYIFSIENRKKRKARLAHEVGEGAKCKKCEDKCSGFQLHFWRKICINCRCGKDDHEVEDDEEDIGQILIGKLFERPIRTQEEEKLYSYGTNLDIMDQVTGKTQNMAFDWVPPGVAKEVAKKYMEQLPVEKRPIVGSEAAKKRKRQLEQQLPLYDVDETERCEDMAPEEYQNFQKYLKVLRTKVAGQAKIQEIVALAPKQHATILTNLNKLESFPSPPPPNYSSASSSLLETLPLPPPPEIDLNSDYSNCSTSSLPRSIEALENTLNNNANAGQLPWLKELKGRDKSPYRNHSMSNEVIKGASNALGGLNLNKKCEYPLPAESAILPSEEANLPHQSTAVESAHKDSLYANEPTSTQEKNLNQSDRSCQTQPHSNNLLLAQHALSKFHSDPEKTQTAISKNFETSGEVQPQEIARNLLSKSNEPSKPLPNLIPKEGLVPVVNASQAPYGIKREKIIGIGNETHSGGVKILLPSESQPLKSSSPSNYGDITSSYSCQHCEDPLLPGDVAVICERAGPNKFWHPSCFVCATCKELLADLIYFYKDDKVYCGRHFHEAASVPRCHACDELIFGESWTRADGFDWHINHFCCFVCDAPLGGSRYVPDQKGYPHCLSCYMTFLAKMCEFCEEKITPDQPRTGYRGYFYHAQPKCFCCFKCRKSLMGLRFKMAKNWVFCSQDCINLASQEIASNPNPKENMT